MSLFATIVVSCISVQSAVAAETFPPLELDQTAVIDVVGVANVTLGWKDSYSVGSHCYCISAKLDNGIGSTLVDTPIGMKSVEEVCRLLGKGPGQKGRPVYNDVQCGHGPANNMTHETNCPGRTDHGVEGCGSIGPKWNFEPVMNPTPVKKDTPAPVPSLYKILQPIRPIGNFPTREPESTGSPTASYAPSSSIAPTKDSVSLRVDNANVLDNVKGNPEANVEWMDSYSVNNRCYCALNSNNSTKKGEIFVDTPLGNLTVNEICDILGPGPGPSGRPKYNDVQCGNGPKSFVDYDGICPGRVDHGQNGCKFIGPKWNFDIESGSENGEMTVESAFIQHLRQNEKNPHIR